MSKIDRVKETLAWLKVLFSLFMVADFSVLAWLVQNYNNTGLFQAFLAICAVGLLTTCLIAFSIKAKNLIASLEDL